MKKLFRFAARHLAVSALTVLFSLIAIVGSAYGFSKIADITSVSSDIPEVKSVEVLSTELKSQISTPATAVPTVFPTQNPNSNTSQDVTTSSQEDSKLSEDLSSPTPIFEKDDDTEDLSEEKDEQDAHLDNDSKDEDR